LIKSMRIPIEKLKRMALITGSFGILSGVLSLNAVLLVIAPRVSGDLKDGIFWSSRRDFICNLHVQRFFRCNSYRFIYWEE